MLRPAPPTRPPPTWVLIVNLTMSCSLRASTIDTERSDDGASEEAPAAEGQADASTQTAAPAAAASSEAEVCAVGDGFFDGIVGFSDDGDVTLVERCN